MSNLGFLLQLYTRDTQSGLVLVPGVEQDIRISVEIEDKTVSTGFGLYPGTDLLPAGGGPAACCWLAVTWHPGGCYDRSGGWHTALLRIVCIQCTSLRRRLRRRSRRGLPERVSGRKNL